MEIRSKLTRKLEEDKETHKVGSLNEAMIVNKDVCQDGLGNSVSKHNVIRINNDCDYMKSNMKPKLSFIFKECNFVAEKSSDL